MKMINRGLRLRKGKWTSVRREALVVFMDVKEVYDNVIHGRLIK